MPAPKTARKSSTTAVSSQPSLKASFAAVRNAKNATVGEKKKSESVITPITVIATPAPVETAPKAAPKKVLKKRESTTDDDSEIDDDYEPISPIVESDLDAVEVGLRSCCDVHILSEHIDQGT